MNYLRYYGCLYKISTAWFAMKGISSHIMAKLLKNKQSVMDEKENEKKKNYDLTLIQPNLIYN